MQTGKRQALHDRLQARGSLRHRKGILQRRIRFLHTLGDVEAALNMPGAPSSSRARRPPLQEEIKDGDITEHCGSLERLAHAWLSLAADLPAFPAAGAEEEDDVPSAAAMGLRLQRAERALLVRLAAAFRVVICPQDLVVAVVKGGGNGEEDASSVEPIAVGVLHEVVVRWMDGKGRSPHTRTHSCRPSSCNRHQHR